MTKENEASGSLKGKDGNQSTAKTDSSTPPTNRKQQPLQSGTLQKKGSLKNNLFELSTFHIYFAVFALFNLIAVFINHIDDTDETYGYWEPLHYLLYGKGMQTWEYSPQFALRSYTFVYPLYLFALQCKFVGFNKIQTFYSIRIFFGVFTAYAEACFVKVLETTLSSPSVARITLIFLLTSPGVFFASTAYLPSAVSMSLLMLSYANWMDDDSIFAIIWGSIAVIWTGWPFVGLLFAPIGIHMIWRETKQKKTSRLPPSYFITKLCISGVLIVATIFIPAISIDFHFYQKFTVPSLNIFLYNAIGSSHGDELYGVEPAAYYFKNLFLNTGLAWPLILISPIVTGFDFFLTKRRDLDGAFVTILASATIWLVVLFNRPHKEERFLYPCYPLIAYLASVTVVSGVSILDRIFTVFFGDKSPATIHPEILAYEKTKKLSKLAHMVSGMISLFAVILAYCRISANYRNYRGYNELWSDTSLYLEQNFGSAKQDIKICMGNEWYLFPSHFFLPHNARIEYFEDGFHGVLPAHFESENGTSMISSEPFNNMNREEKSRYVTIDQCDFIVKSDSTLNSSDYSTNDIEEDREVCSIQSFEVIRSRPIILNATVGKEWARAYNIPTVSSQYVTFKQYQLLKSSCKFSN